MTDIIERVARSLAYKGPNDLPEEDKRRTSDPLWRLWIPEATAALEELAKGLVWRGPILTYNGLRLHHSKNNNVKAALENDYRKQLFGLGPKEG